MQTRQGWGRRPTANPSSTARPDLVPHWFTLGDDRPLFAFAGIWRPWTGERKKETREHLLYSFLTTEANEIVRPIRAKAMPVILASADEFDVRLSADVAKTLRLQRPLPALPAYIPYRRPTLPLPCPVSAPCTVSGTATILPPARMPDWSPRNVK